MAYREKRDFCEKMRCLGYPRVISIENFVTPNFELVADCLEWLVKRYDPDNDMPVEIETDTQRVEFLQAVAQTMLTKARLKLNIKRLYSSDGHAVKELLWLADLLYKSMRAENESEGLGDEQQPLTMLKDKLDLPRMRRLVSEITSSGANIYDGLSKEPELRTQRKLAMQVEVATDSIERSIREAVMQVNEQVAHVEQQMAALQEEEAVLSKKTDKRKAELERQKKRYATLQQVRPGYMDELERVQAKLGEVFGEYLEKHRNLQWLEAQLDHHHQQEQARLDATDRRLQKMQRKLAEEELRILRGEMEVDEDNLDRMLDSDDDGGQGSEEEEDLMADATKPRLQPQQPQRPAAAAAATGAAPRAAPARPQVVGSLLGGDEEDDEGLGDSGSDGNVSLGGRPEPQLLAAGGYLDDEDDAALLDEEEDEEEDDNF